MIMMMKILMAMVTFRIIMKMMTDADYEDDDDDELVDEGG